MGGQLEHPIRRALESLRLETSITRDSRISIKPNFTYPRYKPGVTTSPAVLEAAVRVLREFTTHIRIVESDGGSAAWSADEAFAGHGLPALCRRYSISAVNLSRQPRVKCAAVVRGREVRIDLPRLLVEESDFFITVPVPKVHVMTRVSLGFKNQWGCIPDVKRVKHHPDFDRKIVAINKLLRCRLTIFDGTYFLDKSGPMNGLPVRRNLLITGELGAAERVCCEIMGVEPRTVSHLRLAVAEGMMPRTLEDLSINVNIEEVRSPVRLHRSALDWLALAVFHTQWATDLVYDSALARPIHELLYVLRGRPKEVSPRW